MSRRCLQASPEVNDGISGFAVTRRIYQGCRNDERVGVSSLLGTGRVRAA